MARFYDSASTSDLKQMEELLKKGGIGYSLRILTERPALREILVAEEDIAAAEELLANARFQNNKWTANNFE